MAPLAVIGSLGTTEILLIFGIVVLLFGARRIPELAKGLGQGIRGFRSELKGDGTEAGSDDAAQTKKS